MSYVDQFCNVKEDTSTLLERARSPIENEDEELLKGGESALKEEREALDYEKEMQIN